MNSENNGYLLNDFQKRAILNSSENDIVAIIEQEKRWSAPTAVFFVFFRYEGMILYTQVGIEDTNKQGLYDLDKIAAIINKSVLKQREVIASLFNPEYEEFDRDDSRKAIIFIHIVSWGFDKLYQIGINPDEPNALDDGLNSTIAKMFSKGLNCRAIYKYLQEICAVSDEMLDRLATEKSTKVLDVYNTWENLNNE